MQAIGLTDIGNHRAVNEDSFFVGNQPIGRLSNLYLVADGLGGHAAGDAASKITVEAVVDYCRMAEENDLEELFKNAFEEANDKVQAYSQTIDKLYEMGTTLVSLTKWQDKYYIANIGDSRAYLFRNGVLEKITKDHSLVQKLQEEGVITEEEAFTHEKRNLILRAVGMEPFLNVDTYTLPAEKGDILMLCSDGLSNFLRRQEMQEMFCQEENSEILTRKLIDTALANGGSDNITVVMVKNVDESEGDVC